jgi:hypothetical protein
MVIVTDVVVVASAIDGEMRWAWCQYRGCFECWMPSRGLGCVTWTTTISFLCLVVVDVLTGRRDKA